jgi:hypothetical protein
MKPFGGIIAATAVFSAVFAQNFTAEETKISTNLAKKYYEKESNYFSISPVDSKGKNRYFICNCENIEISYNDGLSILQDYTNYENRFRYIIKSEKTDEKNNYFFILGISFAKTWLWGNVNEKLGNNNAEISFVQTKSEINYSDLVKSIVVIDFEKLVLQWNLVKINEKESRFCLTGIAEPTKPVPQWLVKTALKKIIPRTIRNLKQAN